MDAGRHGPGPRRLITEHEDPIKGRMEGGIAPLVYMFGGRGEVAMGRDLREGAMTPCGPGTP